MCSNLPPCRCASRRAASPSSPSSPPSAPSSAACSQVRSMCKQGPACRCCCAMHAAAGLVARGAPIGIAFTGAGSLCARVLLGQAPRQSLCVVPGCNTVPHPLCSERHHRCHGVPRAAGNQEEDGPWKAELTSTGQQSAAAKGLGGGTMPGCCASWPAADCAQPSCLISFPSLLLPSPHLLFPSPAMRSHLSRFACELPPQRLRTVYMHEISKGGASAGRPHSTVLLSAALWE